MWDVHPLSCVACEEASYHTTAKASTKATTTLGWPLSVNRERSNTANGTMVPVCIVRPKLPKAPIKGRPLARRGPEHERETAAHRAPHIIEAGRWQGTAVASDADELDDPTPPRLTELPPCPGERTKK